MNDLLRFDNRGLAHLSNQGIIELAYQDKINGSLFEWQDKSSQNKFDQVCEYLDCWPVSPAGHTAESRHWFTPAEYQQIDLRSYVLERCKNQQQRDRATEELDKIESLGATHIFLHLIYLVNLWRSKNRVWGIGRGSSVSCFVLYAIGLNKINPLDYDLDSREFFKSS